MKENFLTYEQSLLVKQFGFKESCLAWYLNDLFIDRFPLEVLITLQDKGISYELTKCPLKSQLFKWLREKYKFHIEFSREEDKWKFEIYEGNKHIPNGFNLFVTYEQAENESINYILKQLK